MKLLKWLHDSATGPRLVAAIIISNLIRFGVMPMFGAAFMTNPDARPLDLMFAYTPEQAFASLTAFGEAGRSAYRLFLWTADLAYPISYTLMVAWAIVLLKRNTRLASAQWPLLAPLLLFGFDLLENTSVIALLSVSPVQPVALAWLASLCTTFKWIFAGISLVVIILAAGLRLANKSRNGGTF